jgi:Asp/Glu/hydantoin racemase
MVVAAVRDAATVAILATVDTTMAPTRKLVHSVAERLGKKVTIVEAVAQGALQALAAGQPELHDELLLKAALSIAGEAEVIILAQGSMARMQESIAKATGKKVVSSMRSGLLAVRAQLAQASAH